MRSTRRAGGTPARSVLRAAGLLTVATAAAWTATALLASPAQASEDQQPTGLAGVVTQVSRQTGVDQVVDRTVERVVERVVTAPPPKAAVPPAPAPVKPPVTAPPAPVASTPAPPPSSGPAARPSAPTTPRHGVTRTATRAVTKTLETTRTTLASLPVARDAVAAVDPALEPVVRAVTQPFEPLLAEVLDHTDRVEDGLVDVVDGLVPADVADVVDGGLDPGLAAAPTPASSIHRPSAGARPHAAAAAAVRVAHDVASTADAPSGDVRAGDGGADPDSDPGHHPAAASVPDLPAPAPTSSVSAPGTTTVGPLGAAAYLPSGVALDEDPAGPGARRDAHPPRVRAASGPDSTPD